jgi:hypothetical protein
MKQYGWLVIVGVLATGAARGGISYRTSGAAADQRAALREAVAEAYIRAQTCDALASQGHLKERVLAIYESGDLRIEVVARDPEEPYQCGYTLSGFLSGRTIHLRPMAFTEDCNSLASTVFHEVLHAATPPAEVFAGLVGRGFAEEQNVTSLERACFPEFYTNVRGLLPPQ